MAGTQPESFVPSTTAITNDDLASDIGPEGPQRSSNSQILKQATTNISSNFSSLLSSARTRAIEATVAVQEGAQTLVQAASARLPQRTKAESSDGEPAAPSEPSSLSVHAGQAKQQLQAATNNIIEAAAGFGRKTRDGSAAAYQAAVQGIRRLTAPTRRVAAVTKADLRIKPCPQVLLLCCNLVVAKGTHTVGLFSEPGPDPAQIQALGARLEDQMLLLPPDVDPTLAAAVIKNFLKSLEEPLLTYKLADRWVAAGKALATAGDPSHVPELLAELPLVNWSTLRLLMEMCYYLASQFNVNGLNALALANTFAAVLLWYPRNPAATGASSGGSVTSQSVVSQASQMAAATLQALRSKLTTTGTDTSTAASEAAAIQATEPPAEPSDTADTAAQKPHVVLDESEESPFLEHTVVQHSTQATAMKQAAAPAAEAGVPVPLQGESHEALVTVIEHMILTFEDLFVMNSA